MCRKVIDHWHLTGKYRGGAKIPVFFQNGLNYDYHFTIKELANESIGQLECLGEYTEKYKTLSLPIEKEIIKVDKEGNENFITFSYKIKFNDSARFIHGWLGDM